MRVLYATDGSDEAKVASALLRAIAAPGTVEINVVSVEGAEGPIPEGDFLYRRERRRAQVVVHEARASLSSSGYPAQGEVLSGVPGSEIVKALRHGAYDLVLLGSGDKGWVGRLLLGSVSTYVLRHSATPALLVSRFDPDHERTRILFGYDGSPSSIAAVTLLARLLDPGRTRVTVLSVAELASPPVMTSMSASTFPKGRVVIEADDARSKFDAAASLAADCAARLRAEGLQAEAEAGTGFPVDRLIGKSDKKHFDLVVVGSRGLGPVGRLVRGSVSEQIARYSSAALIVKAAR